MRQPGLSGAVVNHPPVAGDDRGVGCGEFVRDELLLHGEHGIELGRVEPQRGRIIHGTKADAPAQLRRQAAEAC